MEDVSALIAALRPFTQPVASTIYAPGLMPHHLSTGGVTFSPTQFEAAVARALIALLENHIV